MTRPSPKVRRRGCASPSSRRAAANRIAAKFVRAAGETRDFYSSASAARAFRNAEDIAALKRRIVGLLLELDRWGIPLAAWERAACSPVSFPLLSVFEFAAANGLYELSVLQDKHGKPGPLGTLFRQLPPREVKQINQLIRLQPIRQLFDTLALLTAAAVQMDIHEEVDLPKRQGRVESMVVWGRSAKT